MSTSDPSDNSDNMHECLDIDELADTGVLVRKASSSSFASSDTLLLLLPIVTNLSIVSLKRVITY